MNLLKTKDVYILKAFLGPFFVTFLISTFILLMQFVWKYIDDMIGKGLEWYIILELLLYTTFTLIPLALPLAILFASLMTFGNLSENYELVALKAAGVSLQKAMQPLIILVILISIGAFLFSNYILPITNLKQARVLWDITRKKPAVNIKPNVFYNEIQGFTIRIKSKKVHSEYEELIDVMIYNHLDRNAGNTNVIIAERGIMKMSEDKRNLFLELYNGYSYDEQMNDAESYQSHPFSKRKFASDIIRFDLSDFAYEKTEEDLFKENYQMLNLKQLDAAVDTLKQQIVESKEYLKDKILFENTYFQEDSLREKKLEYQKNFKKKVDFDAYFKHLPASEKDKIYGIAINASRTSKTRANATYLSTNSDKEFIRKHQIEWHRKFTLSFGCLILFFIGAPFGAIIRKGGLGMPAVVSVVFFLLYYVLSITGEKMVKKGAADPVLGMWMASLILLPMGIYITYKATTDSPLFELETYLNFFKKLVKKK